MSGAIDITTSQRKTILEMLKRYLPSTVVWAYGSRVKWTSRPDSDLDMVAFAEPDQKARVSELREAFEESNLPFRVDLFVWDEVPEKFKENIKKEHIVIQDNEETHSGMASEWKELNFEDAPIEIIDGDRGINYPKQNEFADKDFCLFLNAGNVTKDGFEFSCCAFISKKKDSLLRKGKLRRNDVVLTTRGTVGNSGFFDDSIPFNDIRINSGMVILRANSLELLPRFLYLFVRSQNFTNQVNSLLTGSAQPQLPIRDIKRINLTIPPLPEQRAIAHILGTLDDKIELNRKMNETLEEMARALFKHWFVDFEFPNEEGKPYKSSGGEMVPSELGEIPTGWKVERIGEILELAYGKSLPTNTRIDGPYPVYGSGGIGGWHNEAFVRGPGIVVGRKGTVGSIHWVDKDFFPIDTVFFVKPKKVISLTWIYQQLCLMSIINLGADSAVPGVNRNAIYEQKWLLPNESINDLYKKHSEIFISKRKVNLDEINTLSSIRDTLLPKLLSGEVRVKDAEKFVEEAL